MNLEVGALHAKTKFRQTSKSVLGKISASAKIEKKMLQFFHCSAVNPPNENAIFLGIARMLLAASTESTYS